MEQFTFIDCDWASLCLQKNKYVPPEFYCMKFRDLSFIILDIERSHGYPARRNPRQTRQFEEEKRIDLDRKLESIGATLLRQETIDHKVEDSKDVIKIESEGDDKSITATVIIDQSEEDNGDDKEMKIEPHLKMEPQNTGKRGFPFLIDNDEDQDNSRKRIKVKNDENLKGNEDYLRYNDML